MSTTARVGVDITARDMTAQAFGMAERRMAAFGRSVASIGSAYRALAGSAALLAAGNGLKTAVDRMDEMGKAAQRVGVGVEALSRLSVAARLSNVSIQDLGTAMGALNRNIAAIAGGDTKSDAARAFRALGISVTDAAGNVKNAQQVMTEMADRFARMQDGAGKSALTFATLGKGSAALIPLLNGGSASLREMTREAERTGQAISENAAANAGVLNDNISKLWGRVEGFTNLVSTRLIPDLIDWSDRFLQVADSAEIAAQSMSAWEQLKQSASEYVATSKGEWAALKALGAGLAEGLTNDAIASGQSADIIAQAWGRAKMEMRGAAAAAEALRQSVDRSGKGSLPANLSGDGKLTPQSKPPLGWASSEKVNEAEREHNKLLAEAKRLYEGSRSPAQEYADTLARLDLLRSKGLLTMTQYNDALFKAKWEFQESKVSAADAVEEFYNFGDALKSSFGNAFASVVDGTKSISGAFRDMTSSLLASATNAFANKAFSMLLDFLMGGHPLYGGGLGGGLSGILGSLFGGFRAGGGNVEAGKAYVVGEKRPEVFVPGMSGSIVPSVGRGGGANIQIIDQRSNAPAIERQQDSQGNIRLLIRDEVNGILGSGQADNSMGGRFGVRPARTRR